VIASRLFLMLLKIILGAVAAVTATTRLLVILLLCNFIVNRFLDILFSNSFSDKLRFIVYSALSGHFSAEYVYFSAYALLRYEKYAIITISMILS